MTTPAHTLTELKRAHRAVWAAGDYASVAEHIDDAPIETLLRALDVRPGQRVLDVATGTGNLALDVAVTGAQVVGLDLVGDLLEVAARRADEEGVRIEWIEGDAEALPFADASFDHVLSVFGVQFAPRHEVVAGQLARVCRPGGRIGLVNWTPHGPIGALLRLVGGMMPPAPVFASPPPLWGDEDHVVALLSGSFRDLELSHAHNPWRFPSPEDWVAFMEASYGPTVKARQRLSEEGRWDECREGMLRIAESFNEATDGSLLMQAEFLVATGTRRADR